jgi:hypothetical protein
MRKILLSGFALLAFFLIINYASAPGIRVCGDGVCEHVTVTLIGDGVFEFEIYGVGHTVQLLGFSGNYTKAIIRLNGHDKEVEEGEWYTVEGVNVKVDDITTVYFGGGSEETGLNLILGEFYESCPDDCGEGMCDDTDYGKDYYTAGRVKWENGSNLDICESDFILKENYCYQGPKSEEYECPNGCENGACLEELECTTDEECPSSIEYYCSDSYSCTREITYSCIEGECVATGEGGGCGLCPHGCRDGRCIEEEECVGEGGSLGAVIPNNTIQCCPGLTQISAAEYEVGGACSILVGMRGYCTYCGDGVCKEPENPCNCLEDCIEAECPILIDIDFNKHDYYPNDYFEVVVKIYDENKNLIPNQAFSVYNERLGQSSTMYTDSRGIWKETSTVPSDPQYSGEWTFVASVSKEGCEYILDKETIYIHITTDCGDGYCDESEKEIVCDTVCTSEPIGYTTASATIASSVTGGMTAVATLPMVEQIAEYEITPPPTYCEIYCHVKCPKDCTPNCGNGVCDTVVCEEEGCPIPENERNCPQDCKQPNYCGSMSSDPSCICQPGYRKESFQAPCIDVLGQEVLEERELVPLPSGSATGDMVATTDIRLTYRNAYWQCYDGTESEESVDSCGQAMGQAFTSEKWKGYAEEFCESRCNNEGKCGVNAFEVWNKCRYVCRDSDGGKDYYTKGIIEIEMEDGSVQRTEDICMVNAEGALAKVNEWYCDPTNVFGYSNVEYTCPNGCSDGACIRLEKCAEEGEYTSGPVSPEYQYDCCEGLKGFDTKPGVVGRGLLCYDPSKGTPMCRYEGIKSEGWYYSGTGELLRYEDCYRETEMCTYYRCVPSYKYLYLSTDKYSYDLNERVVISTNPFETGDVDREVINVNVKKPYGEIETLLLELSCEVGPEICPSCIAGQYCPPCKAYDICKYTGTYTGTDTIGTYQVTSVEDIEGYEIKATYFRVYDESLLDKYLILRDIDGYIYKDSQVNPGPENIMGYMAHYVKDSRDYAVIVADFENREDLEEFLENALGQMTPREKRMDGYYIYVFENYGQKIYIWTYKTFLVGVTEHVPYAVVATREGYGIAEPVPVEVPIKQAVSEAIPMEEAAITGTTQKAPEFLTGMITGMPVAVGEELKYCGMDSLDPNCVCRVDEIKEEFTPKCFNPPCETHYRCRIKEPTELINAYLDKYPSDIKTAGTECERKGGYCIDIGSSCKPGFEETSFACKTSAEKCCVREVGRDDFLEIVMKLEGIRVKMDSLERRARALSDYYDSVGDENRSEKFSDVADMFAHAKQMIDDIVAKIRANLNNLEAIRAEIKEDINELRTYISSILERMVS